MLNGVVESTISVYGVVRSCYSRALAFSFYIVLNGRILLGLFFFFLQYYKVTTMQISIKAEGAVFHPGFKIHPCFELTI